MIDFNNDFKENKALKFILSNQLIGLDIDEVLADFIGGYEKRFGNKILNWQFSYDVYNNLQLLKEDRNFWLSLEPRISPTDIPFIPACYISKRNFSEDWTRKWIEKNNFPCVPVFHVEYSKLELCKHFHLDYFVDDSISNFIELNNNGIKTFLFDSIHNQSFNVGNYRIKNLHEIIELVG